MIIVPVSYRDCEEKVRVHKHSVSTTILICTCVVLKESLLSLGWWFVPIVLITWEAEIGRIMV
jgi:hypothetical protein